MSEKSRYPHVAESDHPQAWLPPEPLHRGRDVVVDERFGHITCGELVFCDIGPHLAAWSYCGDNLEPARARKLGAALIAWADRKDARHG